MEWVMMYFLSVCYLWRNLVLSTIKWVRVRGTLSVTRSNTGRLMVNDFLVPGERRHCVILLAKNVLGC